MAQAVLVAHEGAGRAAAVVAAVALTLPWIWPFTSGPWPAAQQAIASLACLGVLLLLRAHAWPGLSSVLANAWLAAATISTLIGLLQYFGFAGALRPWVNATEAGEAFANLRQRNQFASLTNLGLVTLLWGSVLAGRGGGAARSSGGAGGASDNGHAAMQGPAQGAAHWAARWVPLGLAALLAVGNAASKSRTGLLTLALLVALAWIWRARGDRRTAELLIAALGAYALAAWLLPWMLGLAPMQHGIASRLQIDETGCGSRLVLWGNVLHLIAQRPWTGWGWGELDFAHFMAAYPAERFCEILDNAHNLPLHLAVELGLPVAVLVCGLIAGLVLRARPWAERDAGRRLAWAGLAVIGLHSLLEYPLWYGPFQLATGCALVLLLPQRHRPVPDDPAAAPGTPVGLAIARGAGLLCLAAAAYTAWDYWRISQIYLAPEARSPRYMSNTLQKIRDSWLFDNQVRFAELVTTQVRADNAAQMLPLASRLLHFSPEPRVAERLIESAVHMGEEDRARIIMERYQTAFPDAYRLWATRHRVEALEPEPVRRLLLP